MKNVLFGIVVFGFLLIFSSCSRDDMALTTVARDALETYDNGVNIAVGDSNTNKEERLIAASVNSENIYVHQLDFVVHQLPNGEISHASVLMATIRELVVIQEGVAMGISISDEEMKEVLYMYQSLLPDIFEIALNIYGHDELTYGLRKRRIYEKTREYIIQSVIVPYIEIDDEILIAHLRSIGIQDVVLDDDIRHFVEQSYISHVIRAAFDKFVDELYYRAYIVYFNQFVNGGLVDMNTIQLQNAVKALAVTFNAIEFGTHFTPPPPRPGSYREVWNLERAINHLGVNIVPQYMEGLVPICAKL